METSRCLMARQSCPNSALAFLAIAFLIGNSRAFAAPKASSSSVSVAPAHVFLRPQPGWITQVSYLKYLDEDQGYEGVQPTEQDIQSHQYSKEIRYFKNAEDAKDPNKECKILQYDPQGHLQDELDRVGPDAYDREFYTDGSLRVYTHWHEPDLIHGTGPWVDGFSMSPVKATVSRFSGGRGGLIVWSADGGTYHRWYFHGNEYLEKEFAQDKCCKMRLNGPGRVDYLWTPQKETLWAESSSEFWIKFNGGSPIHASPHPIQYMFPRFNRRKEDKDIETALHKQHTLEYVQRRARLMTAYGALLIEAGQSWKSLGLEGIRDGTEIPKQTGTSEP